MPCTIHIRSMLSDMVGSILTAVWPAQSTSDQQLGTPVVHKSIILQGGHICPAIKKIKTRSAPAREKVNQCAALLATKVA